MGVEFRDKKYVALLQGSEIPGGRHFRNLIFWGNCYRIVILISCLWPNGKHCITEHILACPFWYGGLGEIEGLVCYLCIGVLAMLRLKLWSSKGESHHPAFVDNWLTIIHTFLALSTHCHWRVLLQGNENVGSVQDFILLSLCMVWIKRINKQGESKIPRTNGGRLLGRPSTSYKMLLGTVTFGIHTLVKSWTARALSHQPAFIDSILTISHTRLACLPSTELVLAVLEKVIGQSCIWNFRCIESVLV